MIRTIAQLRPSTFAGSVALAVLLAAAPLSAQDPIATDTDDEYRVEIERSEMTLPLSDGRQLKVDSEHATLIYRADEFGRDDARPRRIEFDGEVVIRDGQGELHADRASYDWASGSFESDAFRFVAADLAAESRARD